MTMIVSKPRGPDSVLVGRRKMTGAGQPAAHRARPAVRAFGVQRALSAETGRQGHRIGGLTRRNIQGEILLLRPCLPDGRPLGGRMARALIGITSHLAAARWGDWVREAVLSPQSYCRAVEHAGAVPVLIAPIPLGGIGRLIDRLDGVLFSGGYDVDPALYGAARHERTDQPDARRDRFELALARAVVNARLPFLAICRGLHVVNVARGGTLVQHLPDAVGHHGHAPDRARLSFHDVRIDPASTLGKLLGEKARVPGSHHQAVARLGDGLEAAAWADDQVVEAAEFRGNPFGIGVQWRPEETDDLRLFEAFAEAAGAA